MIESDASEDVIHVIPLFKIIEYEEPVKVDLAGAHKVLVNCKGCINAMLRLGNTLKLDNIYFIPEPRLNLMLYRCLDRSRITTIILGGFCKLYLGTKGRKLMGQVILKTWDGLYMVKTIKPMVNEFVMNSVTMNKRCTHEDPKKFIK